MGEFTDSEISKHKVEEESNCPKDGGSFSIPKSRELHSEFENPLTHNPTRSISPVDDVSFKSDISFNDEVAHKKIANMQRSYNNEELHHKMEDKTVVSLLINENKKNYQNISVSEGLSLPDEELSSLLYIDRNEGTTSNYNNYQNYNEIILMQQINNQFAENEHETYPQNKNPVRTYDSEFDDFLFTIPGTRSNTESFSELRFSVSETHSDFNYSDSDSRTSMELEVSKQVEQFSLVGQLPGTFNYPHNTPIDDTTGILYEMSKQINKVPELLSGLKRSISEASISDSDITNNSGGTLEEGVFSCFSHCDNFSILENVSRGQDELGRLEAAVDRMLNQVETQENLLKEDLNFVPLVLGNKEVKALPLLVNTLCISPPVKRKQLTSSYYLSEREKKMSLLSKKNYFSSEPELSQQDTFEDSNKDLSTNCSIKKLEQSVNRLLNEVEKEEEKLYFMSEDSEMYTSPISTTDISSDDDSFGVWWEGAYRSLPRHPARKRLAKNSIYYGQKLKHKTSNSSQFESINPSNQISKSIKCSDNISQSKLLVKTTESGKSDLEIRTCNNISELPSIEGDSKFCKMFKKTQSQAYSSWNRSLPSLQDNKPVLSKSLFGSVGSDDSINYIKYIQPSDCIQYFTPCPSMTLDSTGYCTWTDRFSEGETPGEEAEGSPSPVTTRETDEALLDLAAGLQDNKGSSAGVGPSDSK